MRRILQVVLAAWAGSLWTVCGVVAPSLFAVLPERSLAGEVAGHFFTVASWLGLALGVVALALLARGAANGVRRFDYGVLIVTLVAPVVSEVALRPMMDAARLADDMQRFGVLHGVSAALFGVACLGALTLVWRLSVPRGH